jgi:PEGA domain
MTLRAWFLSMVAICFLGTAAWAQGQNVGAGGMGSAGVGAGQMGNQPQQNPNTNQNANQNQNANEETQPQAPTYLTYTKEANPGLAAGKSGETYPVDFKSAPAGADITVDGYYMGKTPATVELPAGEYLFRVNKWGYREWDRSVVVSANSSHAVNPQLKEDW